MFTCRAFGFSDLKKRFIGWRICSAYRDLRRRIGVVESALRVLLRPDWSAIDVDYRLGSHDVRMPRHWAGQQFHAHGVGIAFKSGTDNALLDNSLIGSSQQDGVAKHEVRAWRFNFSALAISAFVDGRIAL